MDYSSYFIVQTSIEIREFLSPVIYVYVKFSLTILSVLTIKNYVSRHRIKPLVSTGCRVSFFLYDT